MTYSDLNMAAVESEKEATLFHESMAAKQQRHHPQQQQHHSRRHQSQPYFAALDTLRSHRVSLQSEGVQGFDLFEQMATLGITYRTDEQRTNRCPTCWYDRETRCICDRMPARLDPSDDNLPSVKFLLLMHHKEYLNAGNSAKVLLSMLPERQIQLYVYGQVGDFDRLVDDISMDPAHTLTLWPGRQSQTVEQYISQLPADSFLKKKRPKAAVATTRSSSTCEGSRSAYDVPKATEGVGTGTGNGMRAALSLLRVVVLDGTYSNAKNMHKNLQKRLGDKAPPTVALHPTERSRFHRAQKQYGASIAENLKTNVKLDERALRISTAEACGLLLVELGANVDVQAKIVEAVLLNNVERQTCA